MKADESDQYHPPGDKWLAGQLGRRGGQVVGELAGEQGGRGAGGEEEARWSGRLAQTDL